MDFRQLEAYVAVIDRQSFSAASEELNIAQSTVSAYIQSLEQEVNNRLIVRSTKKFEVTTTGWQLYSHANMLLQMHRKIMLEMADDHRRDLHIGVSAIPGKCVLPSLLNGFHAAHPMIHFLVSCLDSAAIIEKVEKGVLDVGLTDKKIGTSLIFEPITSDKLVLAVPNTAYFREQYTENADLEALLKEPMILCTSAQLETELLQNTALTENDLNVLAKVSDIQDALTYAMMGMGITIAPSKMIIESVENGKLLAIPLRQYGESKVIYLAYRSAECCSQSAKAFIRYAKENTAQFCKPYRALKC